MTRASVRRALLLAAAATSVLVVLAGFAGLACRSAGTRRRERDRRVLIRMARLLYPHPGLDDGVYAEALAPLLRRAEKQADLATLLRAGVARLDEAEGGDWLAASCARQVTVLEHIEGELFFERVQSAVRYNLYNLPAVWRLIGYDGPSPICADPAEFDGDTPDWLMGDLT